MFPRPDNISKAYGGGRTLKPGEALESEDAKAARSRRVGEVCQIMCTPSKYGACWRVRQSRFRVAAPSSARTCLVDCQAQGSRDTDRAHAVVSQAMKRYRQSTGLDVDPAIQAQAQVRLRHCLQDVCRLHARLVWCKYKAWEVDSTGRPHADNSWSAAACGQTRLDSGMADFRRGQLTTALVHFTDAAALMPLRSPVSVMLLLLALVPCCEAHSRGKVVPCAVNQHPMSCLMRFGENRLAGRHGCSRPSPWIRWGNRRRQR